MDGHRIEGEHDKREAKVQRRLKCNDWVSVALVDLKEERDYLAEYGVEKFFPLSVAKLAELDAARSSSQQKEEEP